MSVMFGNFLRGVGSIASIFPPDAHQGRRFKLRTKSAAHAFSKDWKNISTDFEKAVVRVRNEQKKEAV